MFLHQEKKKWLQSEDFKADSEQITKVPANLDLTPYVDENDNKLIKVMQRAMVP